ncbi:MAG: Crossover junction endodeoxyribonuclease RuvC [Candidatus Yanofskybacteria bacterium GW2011_GWA1_44_21]|nr:MAG: Crossover junction endodeoxyribonuclease RuvC [Candidatus Yanofskybacteria bacterium GW2011_GWA1_44_21]KKT90166.1 MAG: Crossover junction endodeoxyribonuclease RuvC [Candidatus Yanofskybacteria bacterium GW2011_GWB1_45_11]
MGVDPGTHRIGVGIIDISGPKMICCHYELIENSGDDKIANFKTTAAAISRLVKKYKPDIASVEKLFFTSNQKTVMAVSEMRGVIINTIAGFNIPLSEYTPLQIKMGVTGYGKADKGQIERMVRLILGIKEKIKPDDVTDALAIAICGATNYNPY